MMSDIPNLVGSLVIRESMERKMIRLSGFNPREVYKGFRNLERRKLVRRIVGGYGITSAGSNWFQNLKFRKLAVSRRRWDKKWRVIIFDIPEEMRKQRNIFRSKLKSLDFYMLQKSVFVCPFPCEEELGFMAGYLKVGGYINVIIAESIGFNEPEIKKHYGF